MRNLKKFLALVLAFVMAASLLVTANAATANVEFSDSESVTEAFAEDITVLNGMDIIKGYEDGTFGPGRSVTRAQMAAFVYRIATGDANDVRTHAYVGYNTFSDVDTNAWYAGYIGYCANAQYIVGYTDGTFRPNNTVTGYAALAMILRAMGYNEPGHNFVGTGWEVTVSSTATEIGMLAKISQTSYNATLKQAAPRELVAEMLFQGLMNPTVQWTAAYGYQSNYFTTNGQSIKSTLGLVNYGLTNWKGIVVGNADTGEAEHVTKVGFDLGFDPRNTTTIPAYTNVSSATSSAYFYEDYYTTNSNNNRVQVNDTHAFVWDTSLNKFGHAVDVWFDNRVPDNHPTYAVFDRVVESKVVAVDVEQGDSETATASLTTGGSLLKAVTDAGFAVGSRGTYVNYSFGPTQYRGTTSYVSPVKVNNGDDDHQLYLVISNTAGKVADLIIALNLTITEITQQNNVLAPYTVGVYTGNDYDNDGTGTRYFDYWDREQVGATWNYSNIAQSNLVATSVGKNIADLGSKVVAITVAGTKPGYTGRTYTEYEWNDTTNSLDSTSGVSYPLSDGADTTVVYPASLSMTFAVNGSGNAPKVEGINSTYYYKLSKLTNVVPATVVGRSGDGKTVYLSNGGTIERSIFADAVDGSFKATGYVYAPVNYGTYNFYLDDEGKYMFWEPINGTSTFVYGTYLDYSTDFTTSEYKYSIVGVDINGETIVHPVTNFGVYYSGDQDWKAGYPFNNLNNYNLNPLPKRDASTQSGHVMEGVYVGYTIADGKLSAVTPENAGNGGTGSQPVIQASDADFGSTYNPSGISIGSDEKAVGAVEVIPTTATEPGLFITNNTKIYAVSGAGTANQTVKVYNGINDLLEGHTDALINSVGNTGEGTVGSLAGSTYGQYYDLGTQAVSYLEMIYFTKSPFIYAQNYANSAYEIKELFIPAEAISFQNADSSSVYFVGDSSASVINAIGENATKFIMYNDEGEMIQRWIKGIWYEAGNDANIITTNGDNVFYKLKATGSKAQDGETIYQLVEFDGANVIGQYWDDATLTIGYNVASSGIPAVYKATTFNTQAGYICLKNTVPTPGTSDLYGVGSAKIINLSTSYPGINGLATLNQAGSLTDNVGVPVSCFLNGDDARTVDVVFVNAD